MSVVTVTTYHYVLFYVTDDGNHGRQFLDTTLPIDTAERVIVVESKVEQLAGVPVVLNGWQLLRTEEQPTWTGWGHLAADKFPGEK